MYKLLLWSVSECRIIINKGERDWMVFVFKSWKYKQKSPLTREVPNIFFEVPLFGYCQDPIKCQYIVIDRHLILAVPCFVFISMIWLLHTVADIQTYNLMWFISFLSMKLIRNGEIDVAFGKLREWYPQIAEVGTLRL